MLPRAIKFHKDNQAILIQKYVKGFTVVHKQFTEIRSRKLEINAAFFDEMKFKLWDNTARIIQKQSKVWREKRMKDE